MVGNLNMDVIDGVLDVNGCAREGTGFVGPDVPVDLLLATGRPFGHLPWVDEPTPWADRWLESGFPRWIRSILEQWQAGRFDGLPHVVFSRADDASQRLYYYVLELQRRGLLRGPRPLVFDCALIPREASLAHTAAAVRELGAALDVTSGDLVAGIARGNTLRAQLRQLQSARGGDGPFHERLARAALFSDPSAWLAKVSLPLVAARKRVLLAGSVPPDDRLHRAVEAGGASVVAELHVHALTRHGDVLDAQDGDAAVAIARHVVAGSVGPRSFIDRGARIVEAARAAAVQAVVLWQTREEEALAWHVPAQRRALEAAGLPALVMPSRDWRAADGALESIQKFCAEIPA